MANENCSWNRSGIGICLAATAPSESSWRLTLMFFFRAARSECCSGVDEEEEDFRRNFCHQVIVVVVEATPFVS